MWDLILPCVSVRDSIFHTTYAGLLVPNIHHTGTTDSRPKGGTHRLLQRIKRNQESTHRLLQRIKRYQEGTHWLLQRIKRYQEGYHWLLLYQEAHIDSYKGSIDIKRHTLTLSKTQISERHTSTSVYGNIKGTHWPKLLKIDIKVVHSMQLHHKDKRYQRGYKERPRYQGGTHQILQKHRDIKEVLVHIFS